jgi:hypothetical protein
MEEATERRRINSSGTDEMKLPKPIITKEHGTWAILLVPMAVAATTAGTFSLNAAFLVVSALGVFLSFVPMHSLMDAYIIKRRPERFRENAVWCMIYLVVGVGAALPLIRDGFWMIVPLGSTAGLILITHFLLSRSLQKSVVTDIIAVCGLALGAPAMYYILTRSLDIHAWILFVINVLFFSSSVVYVHMKIRVTRGKQSDRTLSEKLAAGRLNLAFHAFVISVVLALSIYRLTPATAVLAFVPMTIHALVGTYRLSFPVSFSRLGFALLTQSIGFALLWTIIVIR